AALDDLRNTVDVDELVDEFAVTLVAVPAATFPAFLCHILSLFFSGSTGLNLRNGPISPPRRKLEAETAFARRIGKRLDAAVIEVRPPIKNNFLDPRLPGAFGKQLPDGGGGGGVGACPERS